MQYVFVLTPDEVGLIGDALGRLPYDRVAGLIQNMRNQALRAESLAKQKAAQDGSDISNVPASAEASDPDEQSAAA